MANELSPLDNVRLFLGLQTDAEAQMLARRNAEAIRLGDAAARARGDTPPVVTPAQPVPVTTPVKPVPAAAVAAGQVPGRTTAEAFQQQQETKDAVMKEFDLLYGPRPGVTK